MNVDVPMPDFGGDAKEGTIVAWHKQPGERVAAGELLLEVMTDKVNVEIEAPVAGTVAEILCAPDDVIPVGQTIARIRPA
ncbi:MAG: lipoyl domain-containing protein [Burkholderiales bacterium]|nr:MAG: lipoyl domain-containing protein [Burkholderiales bacterium]